VISLNWNVLLATLNWTVFVPITVGQTGFDQELSTQTQTDRHTDRQTDTHRQTDRHTDRQTDRLAHTQTDTHTHADSQTDKERGKSIHLILKQQTNRTTTATMLNLFNRETQFSKSLDMKAASNSFQFSIVYVF
jgi:hypothetical protein